MNTTNTVNKIPRMSYNLFGTISLPPMMTTKGSEHPPLYSAAYNANPLQECIDYLNDQGNVTSFQFIKKIDFEIDGNNLPKIYELLKLLRKKSALIPNLTRVNFKFISTLLTFKPKLPSTVVNLEIEHINRNNLNLECLPPKLKTLTLYIGIKSKLTFPEHLPRSLSYFFCDMSQRASAKSMNLIRLPFNCQFKHTEFIFLKKSTKTLFRNLISTQSDLKKEINKIREIYLLIIKASQSPDSSLKVLIPDLIQLFGYFMTEYTIETNRIKA